MYPLTNAWISNLTGTQRQIYLLVELLGIGRFFANVAWGPGGPWTLEGGALMSTGLTMASQHQAYETMLLALDQGGVSDLNSELDDATGAAQVGAATLSLINTTGLARALVSAGLDNSAVRIRLGIGPGLGRADMVSLWYGFVDSFEATLQQVRLECVAGAYKWHRDLTITLGDQYFTGTPADNRGAQVPILVGLCLDVEAVQVTGVALGHLALDVSVGAHELYLVEIAAPFPPSGSIAIESETGVTYAGRDFRVISGQSYLRLTGLVRTAPATHLAGDAVTRTDGTYDYLLGFYEASVLRVRSAAGVVQNPIDYTVLLDRDTAPYPVTLIRFASDLGAAIRVDAEGGNVGQVTSFLENGGFETGDISDWVLEPWNLGGIADAQVTTTTPAEGIYRLELTGDEQVPQRLYQDLTLPLDRTYILRLAQQDSYAVIGNELLTNGRFATGDLTGWQVGVSDARIALTTPYYANTIDYANKIGLLATWVGPPSFHFGEAIDPKRALEYQYTIYQDFTTVVGAAYVISVKGGGVRVLSPRSLPDDISRPVNPFILLITRRPRIRAEGSSRLLVELGTPDDAHALAQTTLIGKTRSDLGAYIEEAEDWSINFTATETTTRLQLTLSGESIGYAPPPAFVLVVSCYPVNLGQLAYSRSRIALGDASTYNLWGLRDISAPQGKQDFWQEVSLPFTPRANPVRLSLISYHTNIINPQPSLYDNVRIEETGRNPVDVIRYVITQFVPQLRIDEPSFDAAFQARLDWRFGGQLRAPGNSRQLLDSLADQCACRRFEDGDGRCKLVPIDPNGAPVFGLTPYNIARESVSVVPEPLDNIYTHLYVHYNLRSGTDAGSAANYGAVAFATPYETTATQASLRVEGDPRSLLQHALALYGREHRLDYFAPAIQDDYTAHLLLGVLVQRHAVRTWDVRCACLDMAAGSLQVGDLVACQHALMPGGLPMIGEVQRHRLALSRATVDLTLRIVRMDGSVAEWEPPPTYPPGLGSEEAWNMAITQTQGSGSLSVWEATELLRLRRRLRRPPRPGTQKRRRRLLI